MEWQIPEDTVPSEFITESDLRLLRAKPPASGAWRIGDPVGNRQFVRLQNFELEFAAPLPEVTIAYETFGSLNQNKDNVVLLLHALTGDSHVLGAAGTGHQTAGWWEEVVGPGKAIDTERFFVVAPNVLGGCQGSTGPASLAPDNREWAARFPYITIRDQVKAQKALLDQLELPNLYAVIGGSVGGMHALEWAVSYPKAAQKVAVIASPAKTSADQIAFNSLQESAIKSDPNFRQGNYYDYPDGLGPHQGLAFARKLGLFSYRGITELNERFDRSWQSSISPLGSNGVFAVESYLDFHGNKFTRRFDANSYLTLIGAMNSHDIGRDRDGVINALNSIEAELLVIGITSDRLFPLADQQFIAKHTPSSVTGAEALVMETPYGHDGFLIESEFVGKALAELLG